MGQRQNKEVIAWRNDPFTFKASQDLVACLKRNVNRNREALMCRHCGCVFIVGGDTLTNKKRSQHVYCSQECKYADRSRVYKANWRQHVSACEKIGKKKYWPHSNVHSKRCSECDKAFYARYQWQCQCSNECVQAYKQGLADIARERAAEKAKLAYWQQKKQNAKDLLETIACIECETVFTPILHASRKKFCCTACAARNQKRNREHVRRERMNLPNGLARGKTSLGYIIKKFKGKCCCCNQVVVRSKEYHPNQASIDHIIPLSKGGLHIESNLQLMCVDCNARKSDRIQAGTA